MAKRDYYEVLGVTKSTDAGEIKKAYRKVAMECHPDRNPGDHEAEERFKEAAEAYEVLSDPQKRQIYDQYGHRGVEGTGFQGFHSAEDIFGSMGDIFEEFFGGSFGGRRGRQRSSGPRAQQGRDAGAEMSVSFLDAALGVEKDISVDRAAPCGGCNGTGAEAGSKPETCATCQGAGQVAMRQGFFMIQTTCPDCRGEGVRIGTPCRECRGRGLTRSKKKLTVKVPPGIEPDMQLVLRGEGDAGLHGGPAGDLYVTIHVADDAHFTRDGDDLVFRAELTMVQAALGTELMVPTLAGTTSLKIAAGTDAGTTLRIKNEGIPNVRSGRRGDLRVECVVRTPKKLSKRQRELLEEFARSS